MAARQARNATHIDVRRLRMTTHAVQWMRRQHDEDGATDAAADAAADDGCGDCGGLCGYGGKC